MNPDEVSEATTEAAQAAEHLAAHLDRLIDRMRHLLPVDPADLQNWGDDPWERLHALLRMFEQLYDLTSRKLFRGYLVLSGETVVGLSARNQFRRVEALGGIASADRWLEISATRNILVHDYPTNVAARAQRANRAWADLPDLISQTRRTIAALRTEHLI
ncbi:hypothetical protein [Sphingomonas psychrolutea]|uniref:DUF86 domain-containing protein n=1 Tax=Sphingomonas psychrolutea TaxID=1259676 RepID=A0ABQ1H0Q8_9SPHN|nr:hypothetical protein [Sphingomonas psychrolutea]GGA53909.1 hypothetical protein GCM10011395_25370 [Sphingomonas psychrolutea]